MKLTINRVYWFQTRFLSLVYVGCFYHKGPALMRRASFSHCTKRVDYVHTSMYRAAFCHCKKSLDYVHLMMPIVTVEEDR